MRTNFSQITEYGTKNRNYSKTSHSVLSQRQNKFCCSQVLMTDDSRSTGKRISSLDYYYIWGIQSWLICSEKVSNGWTAFSGYNGRELGGEVWLHICTQGIRGKLKFNKNVGQWKVVWNCPHTIDPPHHWKFLKSYRHSQLVSSIGMIATFLSTYEISQFNQSEVF